MCRPSAPWGLAISRWRGIPNEYVRGIRGLPVPRVIGNPPRWRSSLGTRRLSGRHFHPTLGQKLLQPMDVVVAVDDVLLAHQRAEQRQRGLDALDDEFVERALEPHQAFAAGLAMDDQ